MKALALECERNHGYTVFEAVTNDGITVCEYILLIWSSWAADTIKPIDHTLVPEAGHHLFHNTEQAARTSQRIMNFPSGR